MHIVELGRQRPHLDFTSPAPQGRAKEDELLRVVSVMRESPIFRALLNWLDGFIVVLAFQRTAELVSKLRRPDFELPNEVVGYRVIRKLGEGGWGQVPRVENDKGTKLALKMINPEGHAKADVVARFDFESDVCLRLDHPNVVRTYEAGRTTEGVLYMISEYCSGGSCGQHMLAIGRLTALVRHAVPTEKDLSAVAAIALLPSSKG